MATLNTSEYVLYTLSQEYKIHLAQVNRLEHTLKQQQSMILHKSIPKMYQPKVLTPINPITSLTEDFNKDYQALFFKHLERVMVNNNIALEVKKAHLASILTQVDHHLSKCGETPDRTAKLYDDFVRDNQITREVPTELKKVLPPGHMSPPITADAASTSAHASTSFTPSSRCNRKRKNTKKHPKTVKVPKQDHFLSLGHPNQSQPT